MSGGAPVPVIVEEKILCIADLKEAGSNKLPQSARGQSGPRIDFREMLNCGKTSTTPDLLSKLRSTRTPPPTPNTASDPESSSMSLDAIRPRKCLAER
jgi:hypothetical protein